MENISSYKELRDRLGYPAGDTLIFADPINFLSAITLSQLIENPIEIAPDGATTINVLNITRVQLSSTLATTLTDLTNGQLGQEVKLLGDGYTTIQNGTNIFTNTAANKLLAVNKVYTFTKFSSGWIENE